MEVFPCVWDSRDEQEEEWSDTVETGDQKSQECQEYQECRREKLKSATRDFEEELCWSSDVCERRTLMTVGFELYNLV